MARPVRFVGREGELSRLLGALGGEARLVLVVGDAGAGKTRFVTEAMRGLRGTRSSPSSWWPPPWPARPGPGAGYGFRRGCRPGSRSCWRRGRAAAPGTPGRCWRGWRELAAARLLAEDTTGGGGHRPRHALLGEAVAAGLLPGERAVLHERAARVLARDPALAAEVAGHWQAAGRPAEEFPARVAAAEAAERVFGYAEAAVHWQRASELGQAQPDAAAAAGIDVPRLSVRAIDAFYRAGDSVRASLVAEEAYRLFAGHPDPAIAAVVCHRAALFQENDVAAAGLPLMEEALQLFERAPPSFEHADALLVYANAFLLHIQERPQASHAALDRAIEIAEAAGATALIPRTLSRVAAVAFLDGQVEEGFAILDRGWALARATQDAPALVWLAGKESDALLKLGRFQRAAEVALRGFDAARQAGLQA